MDGDGEDRPEEIREFINQIQNSNDKPIVGERIKRSEGILFKSFYNIHKLITFMFTGQSIKFGNFTCLSKSTVEKMIKEKATWNSFSGSLKKTEKEKRMKEEINQADFTKLQEIYKKLKEEVEKLDND